VRRKFEAAQVGGPQRCALAGMFGADFRAANRALRRQAIPLVFEVWNGNMTLWVRALNRHAVREFQNRSQGNAIGISASWRGIGDLRRLVLRQFRKRATGYGSQPFQGHVSLLDSLHQLLCNVFSAFVIAAVRQVAADFFQHHVHVRGRAFIDPGHFAPPILFMDSKQSV
jgi:hypothetical protein